MKAITIALATAAALTTAHAQAPRANASVSTAAAIMCHSTAPFEKAAAAWTKGDAVNAVLLLEGYTARGDCIELKRGQVVLVMNARMFNAGADTVMVQHNGALLWAMRRQLKIERML